MLIGQTITVLGAGIAGLAVATALAGRGAQVRVLEQAGEIAEFGAGLQISPNGTRVLRAMGLETALAADAPRSQAVVLRDFRRGAEVLRMPLAPDGPGFYLAHRADLIALLRDAAEAAGVEIVLGRKVAEVTPGETDAQLRFADGTQETADLLIAADGLHSVGRAAINPATMPFFTGQVAWRATIPAKPGEVPSESHVFMGPGRHLVRYPLRGGRLINVVAVEERDGWAAEGWNHADDPAHLRRAFADFCPEVRQMLDRAENVHLWGLFRHPLARDWHKGRLAILGDAAHPTLPFLAQGANMALEDAWVLAACLSDEDAPQTAFARYAALRRARCARIVGAASDNAGNFHLRPGPYRFAAHSALRVASRLAPQVMSRRFDWLYGHDATAL